MKKKKIICIMLILIFTSGIVIGTIQLYKQYHEYSEGEDSYTDLEDYVKLPEEPERLHHSQWMMKLNLGDGSGRL